MDQITKYLTDTGEELKRLIADDKSKVADLKHQLAEMDKELATNQSFLKQIEFTLKAIGAELPN